MNQQEQMKLVLLYSLAELNGGDQRKDVLQHIQDSGYWYRNDQNDSIRSTRNEPAWRNNFSFERSHLVAEGAMEAHGNGKWIITEKGKTLLAQLSEQAENLKTITPLCYTPAFFQKLTSEQALPELTEDRRLMEQLAQTDSSAKEPLPPLLNAPQPKGAVSKRSAGPHLYLRDPAVAKRALARAGHLCEIDPGHASFLRRNGAALYMEPHHLIPMSLTDYFGVSLDREQNIFSLCSNCHNQIHYGTKEDVQKLVSKLFLSREKQLCSILGRTIRLEELFQIYKAL